MSDVDWTLALARVTFLHGYLREMRKEVAMKNEKLLLSPSQEEAARKAAVPQHQPWPARRRFWHRRLTPTATPHSARPKAPTSPKRPAGAATES